MYNVGLGRLRDNSEWLDSGSLRNPEALFGSDSLVILLHCVDLSKIVSDSTPAHCKNGVESALFGSGSWVYPTPQLVYFRVLVRKNSKVCAIPFLKAETVPFPKLYSLKSEKFLFGRYDAFNFAIFSQNFDIWKNFKKFQILADLKSTHLAIFKKVSLFPVA